MTKKTKIYAKDDGTIVMEQYEQDPAIDFIDIEPTPEPIQEQYTQVANSNPQQNANETKDRSKLLIAMCTVLVASLLFNFVQYTKYTDLSSKYTDLEVKYEELNSIYTPLYNMADFYFQNAVIIPSDTKTYHTYFCETKPTSGRWYIHNKEYAAWLGYKPCSKCNPPK